MTCVLKNDSSVRLEKVTAIDKEVKKYPGGTPFSGLQGEAHLNIKGLF